MTMLALLVHARFVLATSQRSAQNLIKAPLVTFLFNERQKCPRNGSRSCCIYFNRLLAGGNQRKSVWSAGESRSSSAEPAASAPLCRVFGVGMRTRAKRSVCPVSHLSRTARVVSFISTG